MVTNVTKIDNTAFGGVAFLFPGQGAQYPGMALDLLEAGGQEVRNLFVMASDIMGRDMAVLIRDADSETLKRSDIAQPAITLANLAAAAFLREREIEPAACAGFSLGEYAALVTAGVITAEDCFRLVKVRGMAMQDSADRLSREAAGNAAVPGSAAASDVAGADGAADTAPGMAAVIGLSPETVESLIAQWKTEAQQRQELKDLYGANFNSPKQVVVSGTAAALTAAAEKFKAAGARRVLRLPVAGPFHSPLIADAAAVFAPALDGVVFMEPLIPCYSNVSGDRVSDGEEAKVLALRQITEPVRWTAEEALVAALNIEAALETGPGKVLQGLWKDAGSGIPCHAAGTVADMAALLGETE
ncbi:malonyl CoA-acyl carrier protein transacylase [Spirochaetia bacterium]|nr:malonyl CoA-acyl carrier protein transacylase [Spirochaetia bacterium]